jgi:hypothetical protein
MSCRAEARVERNESTWRHRRPKHDPLLFDWISQDDNADALLLEQAVDAALVQHVVAMGYAPDLTDDEVEKICPRPVFDCLCFLVPLNAGRKGNNRFWFQPIVSTTRY